MFNEVFDTSLNRLGYMENGTIYDRYGKAVGYVEHNDIYRGTSPNGQLTYSRNVMSQDNVIYRMTPSSTKRGFYDIVGPAGFLRRTGPAGPQGQYRVYKVIGSGQGQMVGFVDDVGDINVSAGAAALILL
jgi:hypothetical protein